MIVERFSKGTPLETAAGYSRAVRAGPLIFIAGSGSVDATGNFVDGDAAAQTRLTLENIRLAVEQAGSSMERIISTRIFLVHIDTWKAVVAVHAEVFGNHRPVATLVAVSSLIHPQMLVEIEAIAYEPDAP